jgi:hypothetical protein
MRCTVIRQGKLFTTMLLYQSCIICYIYCVLLIHETLLTTIMIFYLFMQVINIISLFQPVDFILSMALINLYATSIYDQLSITYAC